MRRNRVSSGRNPALDPRPSIPVFVKSGCKHRDPRAAHRPRARPPATSSTVGRIFLPIFVVFARNRQKTAEPGPRIWSEFSAKNRELAEIRQFCQIFFRIEDRVAPAAERNPAHGPRKSRRGPGLSGQLDGPRSSDPRPRSAGPTRAQPVARAMFLTNNPVKNDMTVSRETLPNY